MIRKLYRVACDVPNCEGVATCEGTTSKDAVEGAQALGWSRRDIREEAFDCCPQHAHLTVRDVEARLHNRAHKTAFRARGEP